MPRPSTAAAPSRHRASPELAFVQGSAPAQQDVEFEREFYLETYPDVADYPGAAGSHFVAHGRDEYRYATAAALENDIREVASSGLFDEGAYRLLYGAHDEPIRHFLVNYRHGPLRPNAAFDGGFVAAYYARSLRPGENPFLFYCRHREQPWCYASFTEAEADAQVLARSLLFDPTLYRATYLAGREELSPEIHYLAEGARLLNEPSVSFSTAAYLQENADIAAAGMNPLLHFEQSGRAEHRPSAAPSQVKIIAGGAKPDPKRPTIVLASHQASRSGAPILALNLLRRLSMRFNVVTLLMEGGPLIDHFVRMSTAATVSGSGAGAVEAAVQAISRGRAIDAAVLNTVVCVHGIESFARRDIPVVTLIHDFAQYTRPLGLASRAVALSNRVIYPAELVRDAALTELQGLLGAPVKPANTRVLPQGRCLVPSDGSPDARPDIEAAIGPSVGGKRPLVVLGAGHVELRKGVDLFVETARAVRNDLGRECRFVWIGDGYDPARDAGISAHLQDQVRKSGVEDCVVFVNAQDSLDPWMAAADVFFMPSRLDPYPNVVLDALANGLPVVCFEGATGVAELASRFPDRIRAADYLRTGEAAELILAMASAGQLSVTDEELERALDFDRYAEEIGAELEAAMATASLRRNAAERLALGALEPVIFSNSLPLWLGSHTTRTGPAVQQLSRLAVQLAEADLPVGTIRPGVLTCAKVLADSETEPSYASIPSGGAGSPAWIVAWAEAAEHVRRLADSLFAGPDFPKVLVVSRRLKAPELGPLRAVLPRGKVRLVSAEDMTPSEVSDAVTGLLGSAPGVVQVLQFDQDGPTLDREVCAAACAALKSAGPGLLIFAPARHSADTPRLYPVEKGCQAPARLADEHQLWLGAEDRDLMREVMNRLATPNSNLSPWALIAESAQACAIVERRRSPARDFDLLYGRVELLS